jgi:hypothetical protein
MRAQIGQRLEMLMAVRVRRHREGTRRCAFPFLLVRRWRWRISSTPISRAVTTVAGGTPYRGTAARRADRRPRPGSRG